MLALILTVIALLSTAAATIVAVRVTRRNARQHEMIVNNAREHVALLDRIEKLRQVNAALEDRLAQTTAASRRDTAAAEEVQILTAQIKTLEDRLRVALTPAPIPPLQALKVRQEDFMACSARGLLLHASLAATGGEAHKLCREGKVVIDGVPVADPEAAIHVARTTFEMRAGDKRCVVTVIP